MKLKSLLLSFLVVCCVSVSQAQTTFIPYGDVWKYLVTGTDPGATWTQTSYSDATWASGAAQLGFGDGDETTVIGYGPDPNNKYTTTYFRRTISIADPSLYSTIIGNIKRDDGAIVYINGTEVFRTNLQAGTITYNTFASNATDDGNTPQGFSFSPSLLVSGNNTIAVEMHQVIAASADLSFDLELTGVTNAVFLGNVGIGTSTPATRLHIVNNYNQSYGYWKPVMIYNPNLANGEHVQLAFGRENSSYNQAELNFNLDGGVGSANNSFSLGLYGQPTILTLKGTGNVGIGTTTPLYNLDVNGTANVSGIGSFGSMVAYNTADRTTNFERANMYWSGNRFNITTENGGTGVKRDIQILNHTLYANGNAILGGSWSWNNKTSIDANGGIVLPNNGIIRFKDATYTHLGAYDLAMGRSEAGVMEINNGTLGTLRDLKLQNLNAQGNVGIGTTSPSIYKLAVNGDIGAKKLIVTQKNWSDYVFEPAYRLPSLKEVETYIRQHKHLPDVPSAGEVEKNGLDVGDNQVVLLKKIEELTLYVIEQQKQIEELKSRLQAETKN